MRKKGVGHIGNTPLSSAQETWLRSVGLTPRTERVPVPEARGRVTAEPVYARLSMPAYLASAMDGIAVRSERTRGAGPDRPLRL